MCDVVISGIGCNFPQSRNVQDFGRKLVANDDFVTRTKRWREDEFTPACSQIPYESFDELFFGINTKLAKCTDPLTKASLMMSFEAIVDAGYNPASLRGSKTAVFAFGGISEYEQRALYTDNRYLSGYMIMGMSRAMLPNRLSYFFDFNGPSQISDGTWAGGHQGIKDAAAAIARGQCEAALVVTGSLTRFSETAQLLHELGLASADGVTRSFDDNGTGSVRGDGCVALFLQRADQAKRCYARVLAADIQFCGPPCDLSPTLPNPKGIADFLSGLYSRHGIDPKTIAYLEADGNGDRIRDACELNAIDKALVQGVARAGPLPVGSVKSNIGHSDGTCSLASICKVVVAMETGIIPATINYQKPNAAAAGLVEGRLRVVDKNLPLQPSEDLVMAVNTMGLAQMFGHTVLAANPRGPEPIKDVSQHLPRLITFSARTEKAAATVADKIQSAPFDVNYYRLLQDVFSEDVRGYTYRGYVVCPPGAEQPVIEPQLRRTVWFVYSGMGSQWAGMGAALMGLPVFAETIERLHAVLRPRGVDLKAVLSETGPQAFDNVLKAFVGITACQIALTNVLKTVGVFPDRIVGHSVGELGCAYADGCLTEEQTILAAWARGTASNAVPMVKGMMAAIGLGYRDVLPLLPPAIDVACHNSSTSCTVSGPVADVERFVQQLSDQGVFARTVNASDIAYHSRYIQPAGPLLLKQLKEVIPEPKRRSVKWLTTSIPVDQRDSELAKFCSAEYQTNNLLSPVLFEEALDFVPSSAVLVEIAPHGLMQAILTRALPDPVHVPLAKRGHPDPVRHLLAAIGRISLCSPVPKVSSLYPQVQFPVPRGTPSLAELVSYKEDASTCHDPFTLMDRPMPGCLLKYDMPCVTMSGLRTYPLSEELVFMCEVANQEHEVQNQIISLENVSVKQWIALPSTETAELKVQCLPGTLDTIIMYQEPLVQCRVTDLDSSDEKTPTLPVLKALEGDVVELSKRDVYQVLSASGLEYTDKYKAINSIRMGHRDWLVSLAANCSPSAMIEAMLQVYILRTLDERQELRLPSAIHRLDVDLTKLKSQTGPLLRFNLATGILSGEGVYVDGVRMKAPSAELMVYPEQAEQAQQQAPAAAHLLPLGDTAFQTPEEFVRSAVQVALLEAKQGSADVTVLELPNGKRTARLNEMVVEAARVAGLAQVHIEALEDGRQGAGRAPLLVTGAATLDTALRALHKGRADALLVWSEERLGERLGAGAVVLAQQAVLADCWLTLLRRARPLDKQDVDVVQLAAGTPAPRVARGKVPVLVWRTGQRKLREVVQAAVEEMNNLAYAAQARLVIVEGDAPFSLDKALPQLARGLRVNVLGKGGMWSTTAPAPAPRVAGVCRATLSTPSSGDVRVQFMGVTPLGRAQDGAPCHVDYVGDLVDQAQQSTRVMGVGRWQSDDRAPVLDPALRWPVPAHWSSEDAATVPFVYAMVYHSLLQARAARGESILVTDGASAVGQAAIRVATQLGCAPLYTTAPGARERDALLAMFPQLDPAHVLTHGDGAFEYRLRLLTRSSGVLLVANTLPGAGFRAALRCLGYFGRLINYSREDLENGQIGTQMFLMATAVFGCSGSELFHATDATRAQVVEAVSKGIREGAVQPIIGAKVFGALRSIGDLRPGTKAIIDVGDSMRSCDPNKCYVVVGTEALDALLLASRLAVLGARHILTAVASSPSSPPVRQRQRALQRQLGAQLQVLQVRDWDAAAAAAVLKAAERLAPVHSAVLFAKDEKECAAAGLLTHALQPAVGLVLLADRADLVAPLVALAGQRQASGWRASCLGATLSEASDRLGDLLNKSSVAVLPSASSGQSMELEQDFSLSLTASALASLTALSECKARGPRVTKLPSLGPVTRASRENRSLFVLPPLGVLDPPSKQQLGALAAKLLNPVKVVETMPGDEVQVMARAVLRAVLEHQPCGPYNLLGWRLSTVLALEVQRQLEAAGKSGVLFLVHGDVERVQQWAEAHLGGSAAAAARAGLVNGAASRAERGAQLLDHLLEAVAEHEMDVTRGFSGRVHVITARGDELHSLGRSDASNVAVRTLEDRSLDNEELAPYINEHCAWSHLAGEADLRLAIDMVSGPDVSTRHICV